MDHNVTQQIHLGIDIRSNLYNQSPSAHFESAYTFEWRVCVNTALLGNRPTPKDSLTVVQQKWEVASKLARVQMADAAPQGDSGGVSVEEAAGG